MSPLPDGYYPSVEETAPLFKTGSVISMIYIGVCWGLLWVLLVDVRPFLIEWMLLSYFAGVLLYLLWFVVKIRVYRDHLDNHTFTEIVQRASDKIGFSGRVQVWRRDSSNVLFMVTSNPLFTALLVSDITVKDMIEKPTESEVIIADALLPLSKIPNVIRPVLAGLFFMMGLLLESFLFLDLIVEWFSLDIFMPLLLGGIMVLVFLLLTVTPVVFCLRKSDKPRRVTDMYGIPPIVARMRVFGGQEVPEEKIADFISHKRSDLEDEQRSTVLRGASYGVVGLIVVTIGIAQFMYSLRPLADPIFFLVSIELGAVMGSFAFILFFMAYMFRYMRQGRGDTDTVPRDGPVDDFVLDSLATSVQDRLIQEPEHREKSVRTVRYSEESSALVVFKSGSMVPSNVNLYLPAPIVSAIPEAELLVPYILFEARYTRMMKRQGIYSFGAMLPGLIFFIFLVFTPMITRTMSPDYGGQILLSFVVLFSWLAVAGAIAHFIGRSRIYKLDAEIASRYPRHLECLKRLVEAGIGTPVGRPSFKTRVQRLDGIYEIVYGSDFS